MPFLYLMVGCGDAIIKDSKAGLEFNEPSKESIWRVIIDWGEKAVELAIDGFGMEKDGR